MRIYWNKRKLFLNADGKNIACSCVVRNEINGWRPNPSKDPLEEVVHSIPDDVPVMPRDFPVGIWNIGRPKPRSDEYRAPFYIPTDAWQDLHIWTLDEEGGYGKRTEATIRDTAYGLHCSTSGTTLGCIKIEYRSDLLWLVEAINDDLDAGIECTLEVVE